MPIFLNFGKDKVILVTKEEHAIPSTVKLPQPEPPIVTAKKVDAPNTGYLYLSGSDEGPCELQLREVFACYKNQSYECQNAFLNMQKCIQKNPLVPKQLESEEATIIEDLQAEDADTNKADDWDDVEDKLT